MNTNTLQGVCLTLCLCLTAALASAAPYTSPHGYAITLPPGWHAVQHDPSDDAAFILSTPSASGAGVPSFMVRVAPIVPGMTMAALKSRLVPGSKTYPPHTVIISQKSSSLGGAPDIDLLLLNTIPGKAPRRYREIYVLRNKTIYGINIGYPERMHTLYEASISRILASFHWKS